MGLFDLFKGSAKAEGKPRPKGNPAAKWADRVERRVQNYDRQEAIQALSEMASAEAVEVLLKRFTFHMDPSITDQEEKDAAFRGILRAGRNAIEPVRAFAAKAESLAWPMKIIKELLDEAEYTEELLRWLAKWDTEYAKFVDPKVQILAALEEHRHPQIRDERRALSRGRQRARPLSRGVDAPGAGRRRRPSPRSRSCSSTRRASACARRWPRASRRARGPSRKTREPPSATCSPRATRSTAEAASPSANAEPIRVHPLGSREERSGSSSRAPRRPLEATR